MKSLISLFLALAFFLPVGSFSEAEKGDGNRVITHVRLTQSPDAYHTDDEIIIRDFSLEYDNQGRLSKADSLAYQWMSLFSPSILYSNITEGTDFYEYEGDDVQPVKVTRVDNNGKDRFNVTYDYDAEGRVLKETFINKNGHKIISEYRYENEDGYDYVYVDRDDGGEEENYRFRYYEDSGWLKEWKYTEKVGILPVRRDATVIRDVDGVITSVITSAPNLSLESSWTYLLDYDETTGELANIRYTHPFEGSGYILEFTWEDIETAEPCEVNPKS